MFHSATASNDAAGASTDLVEVLRILHILQADVAYLRQVLTNHRKENLTVGELAALVGRTPFTIRRWVKEGRLQTIRVQGAGPRGRLLIPRAELGRLLSEGKAGEVPPTALD